MSGCDFGFRFVAPGQRPCSVALPDVAPDLGLRNRLSREDNAALADTPHIDRMVALVWRGVQRSLKQAAAS